MKKGKKTRRIRIWITAAVTALILLIAFFCYQTVKKTIVNNEKESMAGIARVSAHSLETSLKAKSNLVYAALSGDMDNEEDIQQNMLKTGEKSRYIPEDKARRGNCRAGLPSGGRLLRFIFDESRVHRQKSCRICAGRIKPG